jgi:glycosyltransferase involved in cell wall biosynthesis
MRIVQLVNSLGYGGAEEVTRTLVASLHKRGHSVRVVCLRGLGDMPESVKPLVDAGIEIIDLDKPSGFSFRSLRWLARYLRSERIDVVHSHNHLVHHYAAAAGRMAGTGAVVNTLHGTATLVMNPGASALFWASCIFSDRVVCVSTEVEDVFRKRFLLPAGTVAAIDNGIDLARFDFERSRPPGAPIVFGSIGRLVAVKDHRNLLEAFALLIRRLPSARLRILGGGPLEAELRQAADALGITGTVDFCGAGSDAAGFLRGIDIYVISSKSEGLPLTLLEAMAAGIPVVSTAVGGICGVVKRAGGGWLCPPSDAGALASAMQDAWNASDRLERAAAVKARIREWYSAERMTSDYERLYDAILRR